MAKPFLRWAGSKQQLVEQLARYWGHGDTRYVEPFAGSARLFFQLEPEHALLSDINVELMLTYNEIRENPEEIHRSLVGLPNSSEVYYRIRETNPDSLTLAERAARFIYLNRYCFNGLYRTNQRGKFNVPYGGTKTGNLPTLATLQTAGELLKRATVVCSDFAVTLSKVREGDFVYLDPPFSVAEKRVFREYSELDFCGTDLVRLRECLVDLDRKGIRFLLSYDDSKEGRTLASGFKRRQVRTRRNIAGFAGNRRIATELLIFNTAK